MSKKKLHIGMLFNRVSVVMLYVCFFLVQFSSHYNYTTTSSYLSVSSKTISKTAISKADKSGDKKINIRLNKRFAPSPILCCEPNFTVAPILNLTNNKSVLVYKAPFIPSSHLRIKALRGPPVVA